MRRLIMIMAVLALVVSGCGSSDVGTAGSVPTFPPSDGRTTTTAAPGDATTVPSTGGPGGDTTTTTAAPDETTPPAKRFVDVYLVKDGAYAVAVPRTVAGPDVASNAVRALLEGPTAAEEGDGLSNPVPEDTLLLGISLDGEIATIDLSREYEAGGGSFGMLSRLAVVVYTLTQFPTIDAVSFRLDGQPVTVFGGEGIVLDRPVDRTDFESALPIGPPAGDADVWAQPDLPSLDGVPASRQGRVVLVAADDTLNVRTDAGVDNDILGSLEPGVVVARTGEERPVGSSTWAEIGTPVGPGWVNALFLGAVVPDATFAADPAVIDLLDELAGIIATGGDLSTVASRRGIFVSHHGPPVRYPAADLAGILDDPTTYKWPSAALDIDDPDQAAELPDRTFAEAVTDRFLSAYDDTDTQITWDTPVEAGNGRPPEFAIPFELQGFHYVGVHDPGDNPDYGGLDWITWYVSIDYEDGEPRIVGLTVDEWSP